MTDVDSFGHVVLVCGLVGSAALLGHRLARATRIPAAALFLLGSALVGWVLPAARHAVSMRDVVDVVTIALVVILFDGGLHLGRRRFAEAAAPIVVLGVLATVLTTALVAVLAHVAFGTSWKLAFVLGAALAPTDPAVVFAVLANRRLTGRTSAILEGESGFNDPAGIALLLGFAKLATTTHGSLLQMLATFCLEMAVGVGVGVGGGLALGYLLAHWEASAGDLQPLRALVGVLLVYGAATVAHGSGFLAVLVTGIVLARADREPDAVERFHATLASLGEIVAFVLLGLVLSPHALGQQHAWLDGLILAIAIPLVVRPLACVPLLPAVRLRAGERAFVALAGLKGAVPLLLAALAVLANVPDSVRLYAITFIVVCVSVVVQGGSLPWLARRLNVAVEPDDE